MKAHIIGIAGSGKTTIAEALAGAFRAVAYDLDPVVYDAGGDQRDASEIIRRIDDIRAEASWITDGAYRDRWLAPLLDAAEVVVWLDLPLRVCLVRMIRRHIAAELSGSNAHRGWRKLARFLDYTRRTAATQRAETAELLMPYSTKVLRCRTSSAQSDLSTKLTQPAWRTSHL